MIRGFYTGTSGMISQQTYLNNIANNLSNANTTAYKPQVTAFSSLIYQNINGGDGNYIQTGHGVKVEKTGLDFTQGDLQNTGMTMDCAILGDGFFALEGGEDGTITYTRDGSFGLSTESSQSYLVSSTGKYVLDAEGGRIEVPPVATKKDANGNIISEGGFDPSKVGVYKFPNQYGLELAGGNQYIATERSGEAEAVTSPTIKTGYLESSKVDIAHEMVRMIEATKAFSLGSKVVQTADDMERVVNQLR